MANQSGDGEIHRMGADGSDPTQLTADPGSDASFSPDGTRIAFTSSRDGNAEIYVMNADSIVQTAVTPRRRARPAAAAST